MKFLCIFLGTIALVHSSVIHHNQQLLVRGYGDNYLTDDCVQGNELVYSPINVLQRIAPQTLHLESPALVKYEAPLKTSHEVRYIVKNNPAPVSIPSAAYSYTTKSLSGPLETTQISGPSGTITQEKYTQPDIRGTVEHHGLPSIGRLAVANVYNIPAQNDIPVVYGTPAVDSIVRGVHAVSTTAEKTSIVGPSGAITHEKYLKPSSLAKDLVYKVATPVNVLPAAVHYEHPVAVQYSPVVRENTAHGIPLENTRIVGPSGSITRENYSGSTTILNQGINFDSAINSSPVKIQYTSPVVGLHGLSASVKDIPAFVQHTTGPYPAAISKYTNIAAPDC